MSTIMCPVATVAPPLHSSELTGSISSDASPPLPRVLGRNSSDRGRTSRSSGTSQRADGFLSWLWSGMVHGGHPARERGRGEPPVSSDHSHGRRWRAPLDVTVSTPSPIPSPLSPLAAHAATSVAAVIPGCPPSARPTAKRRTLRSSGCDGGELVEEGRSGSAADPVTQDNAPATGARLPRSAAPRSLWSSFLCVPEIGPECSPPESLRPDSPAPTGTLGTSPTMDAAPTTPGDARSLSGLHWLLHRLFATSAATGGDSAGPSSARSPGFSPTSRLGQFALGGLLHPVATTPLEAGSLKHARATSGGVTPPPQRATEGSPAPRAGACHATRQSGRSAAQGLWCFVDTRTGRRSHHRRGGPWVNTTEEATSSDSDGRSSGDSGDTHRGLCSRCDAATESADMAQQLRERKEAQRQQEKLRRRREAQLRLEEQELALAEARKVVRLAEAHRSTTKLTPSDAPTMTHGSEVLVPDSGPQARSGARCFEETLDVSTSPGPPTGVDGPGAESLAESEYGSDTGSIFEDDDAIDINELNRLFERWKRARFSTKQEKGVVAVAGHMEAKPAGAGDPSNPLPERQVAVAPVVEVAPAAPSPASSRGKAYPLQSREYHEYVILAQRSHQVAALKMLLAESMRHAWQVELELVQLYVYYLVDECPGRMEGFDYEFFVFQFKCEWDQLFFDISEYLQLDGSTVCFCATVLHTMELFQRFCHRQQELARARRRVFERYADAEAPDSALPARSVLCEVPYGAADLVPLDPLGAADQLDDAKRMPTAEAEGPPWPAAVDASGGGTEHPPLDDRGDIGGMSDSQDGSPSAGSSGSLAAELHNWSLAGTLGGSEYMFVSDRGSGTDEPLAPAPPAGGAPEPRGGEAPRCGASPGVQPSLNHSFALAEAAAEEIQRPGAAWDDVCQAYVPMSWYRAQDPDVRSAISWQRRRHKLRCMRAYAAHLRLTSGAADAAEAAEDGAGAPFTPYDLPDAITGDACAPQSLSLLEIARALPPRTDAAPEDDDDDDEERSGAGRRSHNVVEVGCFGFSFYSRHD